MINFNNEKIGYMGGKSYGLYLLKSFGYKIPSTYLVDKKFLIEIVRSRPSYDSFFSAFCRLNENGPNFAKICLKLQSEIKNSHLTDEFTKFLENILSQNEEKWIIRSDSFFEDRSEFSFAGTFSSRKTLKENFYRNLLDCCADFFDPHLCRYVLASGLNPADYQPGLCIQPFIDFKISGVAFSWHHNVEKNQAYSPRIEWVLGDCSKLVNGQISPNIFEPKDKESTPLPLRPFIDNLLKALIRLSQKLNVPLDCEWGYDGKELWFVQLRPICDPWVRAFWRKKPQYFLWSQNETKERFPHPLTPMGWSILSDTILTNLQAIKETLGISIRNSQDFATVYQNRVYSNERVFSPNIIKIFFWRFLKATNWKMFFKGLVSYVLCPKSRQLQRDLAKLQILWAVFEKTTLIIIKDWQKNSQNLIERLIEFEKELQNLGIDCLVQFDSLVNRLQMISRPYFQFDVLIFQIKAKLFKVLGEILKSLDIAPSTASLYMTMGKKNAYRQMHIDWQTLVEEFANDAIAMLWLENNDSEITRENSSRAIKLWFAYLNKYSHLRESWDVASKSIGEDICLLKKQLHLACQQKNRAHNYNKNSAYSENLDLINELVHALAISGKIEYAEFCRTILVKIRSLVAIDDEQNLAACRFINVARQILIKSGVCLKNLQIINTPEDIFWLTLDEVRDAFHFTFYSRALVCRTRKMNFQHFCSKNLPVLDRSFSKWQGQGVSPGQSQGYIKFIANLKEIDVLKFDGRPVILAVCYPHPTLIPLFDCIVGLICECGGMLSHGFLVARELGIPAISGVNKIFEKFKDGDHVAIDGYSGIIAIL